jgi:hypothetical protein
LAANLLCGNTNSRSDGIFSNHRNGGTYTLRGEKINKMPDVRKRYEDLAESYKKA